MAFDGILTKCIVSELNSVLINGKINKVFQPNKNEILLGIYASGNNYALNICIDASLCRLHLTTHTKPNPLQATNFCMFLRKYLIGMRIKSIHSYDLERIVKLELEGYNELNDLVTRKLIIELMGKHSNIILVNENNTILDALRHVDIDSHSNRDILPAHKYEYPALTKVSFLELPNFEAFYDLVGKQDLTNTFIGFSKSFVQSIFDELDLADISNLSKEQWQKVYEHLKDFTSKLGSNELSCKPYNINQKEDFIVSLTLHKDNLHFNFFVDDFYHKKELATHFKSYKNSVLKLLLAHLVKFEKRLKNINDKLQECKEMDTYRIYGELLTANLYQAPQEHLSSITLENYYDNNQPITIVLDKRFSVADNAKRYFKKYHKLKNALEVVTLQKADTAKEIDYIESIIFELEASKTITDIDAIYTEISENLLGMVATSSKTNKRKKKQQTSSSLLPEKLEMDGFCVFVGKNNKQNDYLTTKYAHANDIWFHTKDIAGSHVILKTEGQEVTDAILLKCAVLAATHSKASQSSNVAVDYTFVRYVKKPSGAKPGMVIYTNQKTLYVNPLN